MSACRLALGDRLGVMVDEGGALSFYLNGKDMGVAVGGIFGMSGLDTARRPSARPCGPLWALTT